MEYNIIKSGENDFIISDSFKVLGFDKHGKINVTDIPTATTFREMAYIITPITVIASSFEEAIQIFTKYI